MLLIKRQPKESLRSRTWWLSMRWHDLLFAHWPVPSSSLRHLIPPPLEIDTFDNSAWIGVVPFHMTRIHTRWTPPRPGGYQRRHYAASGRRRAGRRKHPRRWFRSFSPRRKSEAPFLAPHRRRRLAAERYPIVAVNVYCDTGFQPAPSTSAQVSS